MKTRLFISPFIGPIAAFCLAGALVGSIAPVSAQDFNDYQVRKTDLVLLASIFGELHHIRRHCDPRLEGDIWRTRMKKLVDLEEPQTAAREEMVAAFNKSYRAAQDHFPACTRQSRDHAAARAARGDIIIERLTASLIETDDET